MVTLELNYNRQDDDGLSLNARDKIGKMKSRAREIAKSIATAIDPPCRLNRMPIS